MKYLSPLEMLYKWEKDKSDDIYLSQPINGKWYSWTWNDFALQVRKMAAYLKTLDLQPKVKLLFSQRIVHIGKWQI